jgi:hypothetical protein
MVGACNSLLLAAGILLSRLVSHQFLPSHLWPKPKGTSGTYHQLVLTMCCQIRGAQQARSPRWVLCVSPGGS